MKAHGLLTALVVFWAVPVLAQGAAAQQTPPSGQEPQKEPQAQTQPQAPPATTPAPPPFTFALRGFISGSVFVQDGVLAGASPLLSNSTVPSAPFVSPFASTGQGQGALFAVNEGSTDRLIYGGDVRQTRLNFSMKGPRIFGDATPTGVVEVDFFGGFSGGAFGDESVLPRVRIAYIEAAWPDTILRVGQFHNLVIGFIPASAAHIANPFATGAGLLGWRSPGITLLQKVPAGGMNLELGLQVNRNFWVDSVPTCSAAVTSGCLPSGIPFSEASGLPQLQARVALTSGTTPAPWPLYPPGDFTVFAAGEWDRKDLNGFGIARGDPLTTYAVVLGAKVSVGPLLVAGNGWLGQNTGGLTGNILQFTPTGDNLFGWGAWGQLGLSLTKDWAIWGFFGTDRPNEDDFNQVFAASATARRSQNVVAAMLSYKDGPYGVGLEWVQWMTEPTNGDTLNVDQVAGTVTYFF